MDRRTFVGVVAVEIIVAPLAASAQRATTMRRIGYLTSGTREPPAEIQKAWDLPLKEYGWIDGRNLLIERRYTNGKAELLQPFAEELVRLKVEIIVTGGTDSTLAAKSATTTIPIIFRSAGDPVRAGFVASLAHPGGNITGYSIVGPELDAKGIALLRELLPGLQRVGVLENSTNPYYRAARKELEQACQSLSIQPIFVEGANASELEDAVGEVARRHGQALLIAYEALFYANRVEILRAVMKHALPTMVDQRVVIEDGALASYSENRTERDERVAAYIDRILHGAKPADMPVEQPTKFELRINLRTAKALGLTVPEALLHRAHEVIQ